MYIQQQLHREIDLVIKLKYRITACGHDVLFIIGIEWIYQQVFAVFNNPVCGGIE